ncbi:MAG: 16S rRNA (cytosine(1402)-N(4))-methyltransferase RsmH [Patescibacteria group bacterium]|nr:16S rRNA (cytosine(1402)-N(4))-methyltransferase RsmH [Patescibacteria group bacterium]
MSQEPTLHRAVMVPEVIDALKPRPGGRYLDATLGGGTHSEELLKRSAPNGQVLSLDVDPAALTRARERQKAYGQRWRIAEANFRNLKGEAENSGWVPFDGILFDLGLSSDELADPSKGLSFQIDGPLDMRLGPKANEDGLTAETIVNRWSEKELIELIRTFGEEKFAVRIAKAIIERRRQKKFESTLDLADTIQASVPKTSRIHPATRTFQALRMAVNDELASLKQALMDADSILAPGGTVAVISFHSLEDRIVKQTFKKYKNYQISKKPLSPNEAEVKNNPRARSAKLRAAHKNSTKNNYVTDVRHSYD